MTLSIRDLARKCKVEWLNNNRFRVTTPAHRVHFATAKWDGTDFMAECANPVAKMAVEMHERFRVARAQFGG